MSKHQATDGLLRESFHIEGEESLVIIYSFPDTPSVNDIRYIHEDSNGKIDSFSVLNIPNRSIETTLTVYRFVDFHPRQGRRVKGE